MKKPDSQALIAAKNPRPYETRAQRLKAVYTFNGGAARVVSDDAIRVNCSRTEYEEARDAAMYAALVRKFFVTITEYDGTGFTIRVTGVR